VAGKGGALPRTYGQGKLQSSAREQFGLFQPGWSRYVGVMIKLATYNIHKAVGTDRRRNPERIIDVLNELDADVIALQEADRRFGARASALPHWQLLAHSPYRAVPLSVRAESLGWHGNAILVRRDVEILGHDVLHLPCLEPRGAVSAAVSVRGRALRVFGMHLDLSGLWRKRQASALLHFADLASRQGSAVPTVMMGDTNEWTSGGGCLTLFDRHFQTLWSGRSFHARRPVAALDRIMVGAGLRALETGVHASALARRASDHLPVWAVVE